LASIAEVEDIIARLEKFNAELAEDIQRAKEAKNMEVRSELLKQIQDKIFSTALKFPFRVTGLH
jgi:hypothetical protein